MKYILLGGEIWYWIERVGDDVVILICDLGEGMFEDMSKKIFDLFFQVENILVCFIGGMGFGFLFVRSIIVVYNGMIDVYSKGVNQGSEFWI